MKRKGPIKSTIPHRGKFGKLWQLLQKLGLGVCLVLGIWLICTTITLVSASSKPVDTYFVLGGSIRREIYVVKLAKKTPKSQF